MSETPETDAEAMEKLAIVRKQLVAMKELNEARREINVLKRAAVEVLKIVPAAHCSDMHHGKRDMHSALEPCPVVVRYNAKIDKLLALLEKEAK